MRLVRGRLFAKDPWDGVGRVGQDQALRLDLGGAPCFELGLLAAGQTRRIASYPWGWLRPAPAWEAWIKGLGARGEVGKLDSGSPSPFSGLWFHLRSGLVTAISQVV